jgi:hypothetical protein
VPDVGDVGGLETPEAGRRAAQGSSRHAGGLGSCRISTGTGTHASSWLTVLPKASTTVTSAMIARCGESGEILPEHEKEAGHEGLAEGRIRGAAGEGREGRRWTATRRAPRTAQAVLRPAAHPGLAVGRGRRGLRPGGSLVRERSERMGK